MGKDKEHLYKQIEILRKQAKLLKLSGYPQYEVEAWLQGEGYKLERTISESNIK